MISVVSATICQMGPSVVPCSAFVNKLAETAPYLALYGATYPPSLGAANAIKKNYTALARLNEKSFKNSLESQVQGAVLSQLENSRKQHEIHRTAAAKNPFLFCPPTNENFLPRYLAARSLRQVDAQREALDKSIAAHQLELKTLEEIRKNEQFDINFSKAVQKIFISAVIFGLGWSVSKYTGAAVWTIFNEG